MNKLHPVTSNQNAALVRCLHSVDPVAVLEQVGMAIKDEVASMEIRAILGRTGDTFQTTAFKVLKAEGC